MTVPTAVRLPIPVDADALAADLGAVPDEAWEPHFNTQQYEGEWDGVALRVAVGAAMALYPDPSSTAFADTPLLAASPGVQRFLADLRCPVQTVRFLRLRAGARIKEHRDHKLSHADGEVRLHVPVTSNAGVEFRVAGGAVDMAVGETWYLDLSERHAVTNGGTTDRVHLVIDCVVDAWLERVILSGSADHPG
jgi:hypothetical protein